jgi:hypothetical protein
MGKQQTEIRSHIYGRNVRPLEMAAEDCAEYGALAQLGIHLSPNFIRDQIRSMGLDSMAMDDTQGLVTTASISNPVQFLQSWLPGFVRIMTAARRIDEIVGVTTAGKWDDEEVIQGVLEPLGEAALYGDYTNIPLSSWNANYERRTVIRFEKGIKVGLLEDARSARVRINNAAEKRSAAALALDIIRNKVGFYGFNGGANRTYGFLNDPSLPAYVTAANPGSGTTWAVKTFLQITADIRGMFARLQSASGDQINPEKTATTLTLATDAYQYLSVTSDYGVSVRDWLTKTYPKHRVVSAPELNAANGGANVAYLFADSVDDGGTDGGATFAQIVPAKFQALGTEKQAKGYVEDFSNATAGIFVKRPFAVQRLTGI